MWLGKVHYCTHNLYRSYLNQQSSDGLQGTFNQIVGPI